MPPKSKKRGASDADLHPIERQTAALYRLQHALRDAQDAMAAGPADMVVTLPPADLAAIASGVESVQRAVDSGAVVAAAAALPWMPDEMWMYIFSFVMHWAPPARWVSDGNGGVRVDSIGDRRAYCRLYDTEDRQEIRTSEAQLLRPVCRVWRRVVNDFVTTAQIKKMSLAAFRRFDLMDYPNLQTFVISSSCLYGINSRETKNYDNRLRLLGKHAQHANRRFTALVSGQLYGGIKPFEPDEIKLLDRHESWSSRTGTFRACTLKIDAPISCCFLDPTFILSVHDYSVALEAMSSAKVVFIDPPCDGQYCFPVESYPWSENARTFVTETIVINFLLASRREYVFSLLKSIEASASWPRGLPNIFVSGAEDPPLPDDLWCASRCNLYHSNGNPKSIYLRTGRVRVPN